MFAAAVSIVKNEGIGALLSGLGPTIVGYGIEGAMKVRCNERLVQQISIIPVYCVVNLTIASIVVHQFLLLSYVYVQFGVYEVAKPIFNAILKDMTALAFVLASIVAGAVAALLLCPLESLRIRQVTDPSFSKDSLFTGLPRLIREHGIGSLFGGVWAMLAKQVPYVHLFHSQNLIFMFSCT